MKNKFIVFMVLFFSSVIILKADCEYSELRELNNLASYIQSNYEYNEETKKFDITITNLTDKFFVSYENKNYDPSNGTVIISGVDEGTRVSADVVVSPESECYGEKPRMIFVNIPYLNPYYKSNLCNGHESLNVCNSRFFDYKISESTFISLIEEDTKNKVNNDKNDDDVNDVEDEEKPNIIDKAVDAVKEYYIPVILVIVSSGLTISFYGVIIRKIKHGL